MLIHVSNGIRYEQRMIAGYSELHQHFVYCQMVLDGV